MSGMHSSSKLNVLDVGFLSVSMQSALDRIDSVISEGGKSCVFFINADCLNISCSDTHYQEILNAQEMVLPDGVGMSIACRMIGKRLVANLNGTDLLPPLCEVAQQKSYTLFLLGASPGVAARMKTNIESSYPGLKVVGEQHGYFDHETESPKVIDQINALKPNIVLVAFGAPRQEKGIHRYHEQIDANVLMGVGGLFDFYSGDKKRAPMWMRKIGGEWLYRLYLEPNRLWRRYIIGNPLFVYRMFRWVRGKSAQ